ncbi:hypothetical protein ABZ642_17675 [Streptomyces sp. NPDC007157]|uniref:hypothetical protein n=1 Tax=Streptomyces sp. NPDC007157 TaxID=3154681 RepID=UPI00340181B6
MSDVFWSAPESGAVWQTLPQPVLDAVGRCDAARLEVERARVAPHLRERITTPVYSVADRFASWERLVRRMEADRPDGDDYYPISAYGNDLDSRDNLDEVMNTLPAAARDGALGRLLAELDARFDAASAPDPEGSLRPWVRPTKDHAQLPDRWCRKPLRAPWDG